MTDNTPITAALSTIIAERVALWSAGNNAGDGFAFGDEHDDDLNEIKGLGELIHPASSNADVAVYVERHVDGDTVMLVADANGPWVVQPSWPLPDANGIIEIATNPGGGVEAWLEISDGVVTVCDCGVRVELPFVPTVADVQRWIAQGYTD